MNNSLQNSKASFLYLNINRQWLGFHWSGLEGQEDGSLQLIPLPLLEGDLPETLTELPNPDGPAGIAVGPGGIVYYTDPTRHILLKIGPCPSPASAESRENGQPALSPCPGDRSPAHSLTLSELEKPWSPVACLGGRGEGGTQFDGPRGVFYHSIRNALLVADSGNHRIQLFDAGSHQLVDIWGQAGEEPGCFNQPRTLAGDTEGNIYVVDYGNRRVQKFDRWGEVLPAFREQVVATLQQDGLSLDQPGEVTVGRNEGVTEVYILDENSRKIFVFDTHGHSLRPPFGENILTEPRGLCAGEGVLYVGDNHRGRVYQFKLDGVFAGEALHYEAPVAALAVDLQGGLLVHTGHSFAPSRLATRAGFTRKGYLWGGPFSNPGKQSQEWHRLKCHLSSLEAGAHFQLFIYCSDSIKSDPINPLPDTPPWSGGSVDFLDCLVKADGAPACERKWVRMPLDAAEGVIQAIQTRGRRPGQWEYLNYVWIGAEFSGEGVSSPILSQIRLEFDHETYLQYLPAIYREEDRSRQFLGRFMSLFESLYDEVEGKIGRLPELFDPMAVPREFLTWLAGWFAFDLDEDWDITKKRQTIAAAFTLYSQRGTAAGLQAAVRLFTGIDVRLEEPIRNTGWWSLPSGDGGPLDAENSVLGFTTCLVPAEAQGAVVGTTATLDGSHLITGEEFGAPLFMDTAHRFSVQMYRGANYSEKKREEVAAIIDREKPAHTSYHICLIEPRLRIGFQARIGVDTIVAGPQAPTALDQLTTSGEGWLLGGELPGRIGRNSQLGQTARLAG